MTSTASGHWFRGDRHILESWPIHKHERVLIKNGIRWISRKFQVMLMAKGAGPVWAHSTLTRISNPVPRSWSDVTAVQHQASHLVSWASIFSTVKREEQLTNSYWVSTTYQTWVSWVWTGKYSRTPLWTRGQSHRHPRLIVILPTGHYID